MPLSYISFQVASNIVGGGSRIATGACPVGVEKLTFRPIDALIGVGAEVVALRLQQVGGQAAAGVAVEEGEGGYGAGHRQTMLHRGSSHFAPARHGLLQQVFEIGIAAKEYQIRIGGIGIADIT